MRKIPRSKTIPVPLGIHPALFTRVTGRAIRSETASELFSPPLTAVRNEGGFMKNLRSALVALTVLFMAAAAHAQTAKVKATIPFNFVAGDRAYSAGDYVFSNDGVVLKVASTEGTSASELLLSHACEKATAADKTMVVFHQMGSNYFLQQIWIAGAAQGRELPRSKSEIQLAQNHEKSESIIVAANIVK
jgi:hypothetical protein